MAGGSRRLARIPGFDIDAVAAAAGTDADVLRLENLDTDLPPPPQAVSATAASVGADEANSYLPFTGLPELREAVAEHVGRLAGRRYDPATETIVTPGGTVGLLDVLLATVDDGDEVLVTDPTYAGIVTRVQLCGAAPRFVPFHRDASGWRLDLDALANATGPRTRAFVLMNPSMPSGAVLNTEEWTALASLCAERDLWLIYDAAMERILFDGRAYVHPASVGDLADRTITVGSVSKELRMIGWRVGWVVAPAAIMTEIAKAAIYNGVVTSGFAQLGAAAALAAGDAGVDAAVVEWQRRRDTLVDELAGWPLVPAAGGWSMLLDASELGGGGEASRRLLELGRIAATPMTAWGEANASQFVRLVFSNESVERLRGCRERFERALVYRGQGACPKTRPGAAPSP